MSVAVKIEPTRAGEIHCPRSGYVGICSDDMQLVNLCSPVTNGESDWPLIAKLYVLNVRSELVDVARNNDLVRTFERTTQCDFPGKG